MLKYLIFSIMIWAISFNAKELSKEPNIKIADRKDWLLDNSQYKAGVYRGKHDKEIIISNGLVRRTFRISPNAATVGFDNLITGESIIRGVKPEAIVELDGARYNVGGLTGQPNYAFLKPEWIDNLKNDPKAFQFIGFEVGKPIARMEWKKVRHYETGAEWPPKGVSLRMDYKLPSTTINDSDNVLESKHSRKSLMAVEFDGMDTMPKGWVEYSSKINPRSSFINEGKTGEIYTPMHTSVYVEKLLPKGTKLVETVIDVGTDKSASWGPGIALCWKDRVIKFNICTGGYDKKNIPALGVFDGKSEIINIATGKVNLSKQISLRLRIKNSMVYCDARFGDGKWQNYNKIKLSTTAGDPLSVRVGKMDKIGGNGDFAGDKGGMSRLHILTCNAYGELDLSAPKQVKTGVKVSVHYELYDGIPCMSKWITVHNNTGESIIINKFTSEVLAAIEYLSIVDNHSDAFKIPNIHVETDHAMSGMTSATNFRTVHWVRDPQYRTQVNYSRDTPCMLEVRPLLGPNKIIAPQKGFESFHAFIMPRDSYDRERNGLAMRKMYRLLAPWITENPLMMHVRRADWKSVKLGIDQCAEIGFEMIILTFGSGFNIENASEKYLAQMKSYADYAHGKGIEIGGYSLLASRRVGGGHDVVMPKGQKPTFGNSPCLQSKWGKEYFRKLYQFYSKTGFDLLEHDGSYPGDACLATHHPGHKGYKDSRWNQRVMIGEFYAWCRGKGIYLNIPDYYYMSGSTKCGMGYREVNWSLPRSQQLIHTRQNIFDGAWEKTPSMGWMFVPLTQYHGGGPEATIEPLDKHIDHYQCMIQSNLAMGVQACYRGPRLYDTTRVRDMLKRQVNWFKKYRDILESDMIHGCRANALGLDWMLHVNPKLKNKGMLVVFNPLKHEVTKTLKVPLYYTGITAKAIVSHKDKSSKTYMLSRDCSINIEVTVPAEGFNWYLIK